MSNVIAREMFLSAEVLNDGSEYNKVRFSNYNQMEVISGIEGQLNIITRPELRLPPRGAIKFCNVEIVLSPFIDDDFRLHVKYPDGTEEYLSSGEVSTRIR